MLTAVVRTLITTPNRAAIRDGNGERHDGSSDAVSVGKSRLYAMTANKTEMGAWTVPSLMGRRIPWGRLKTGKGTRVE
jgi:hypothetical protein